MAKKLFTILLLCSVFLTMAAQALQNINPITFTLEYVGSSTLLPSAPKSPTNPPEVSIDGNILYFSGSHTEFVLTLSNQDNTVVYVTNVYATDTQITLPSFFNGIFELRLYTDIYCFVGEITL